MNNAGAKTLAAGVIGEMRDIKFLVPVLPLHDNGHWPGNRQTGRAWQLGLSGGPRGVPTPQWVLNQTHPMPTNEPRDINECA